MLGGPTPGITGSLIEKLSNDLSTISTNPNGSEQLFSDFNNYSLELLDHTLKPLLAPLLDETSKGVTTCSIPVELSQIQTNLLEALRQLQRAEGFSRDRAVPRAQRRLCANRRPGQHQRRVHCGRQRHGHVRPEQPAV